MFSHDTHSERERERERRERQERLGPRAAGRRCGFHAACDEPELKLPPSLTLAVNSVTANTPVRRSGEAKISSQPRLVIKFPKEFHFVASQ